MIQAFLCFRFAISLQIYFDKWLSSTKSQSKAPKFY